MLALSVSSSEAEHPPPLPPPHSGPLDPWFPRACSAPSRPLRDPPPRVSAPSETPHGVLEASISLLFQTHREET